MAAKTLLQLGEVDAFTPPRHDSREMPDPVQLEAQLTEKLKRLLGDGAGAC
jgi:hypothetical protein